MRSRLAILLITLAACTDGSQALDPGVAPGDAGAPDAAEAPLDAGGVPSMDAGLEPSDAGLTPDSGLGRPVGAACTQDDECASSTNPNADLIPSPCNLSWPDGYCVDYCQLPGGALDGEALPRSDCPDGAVCVPRFDDLVPISAERPEIGVCLKGCTADSDCRDEDGNYFCRDTFFTADGPRTYDNGYCASLHCRTRGCPRAYMCGC